MSTVGIMSMQRIWNYGSSLQAYALRRLIEGLDDAHRVSYVDYRPGETLIEAARPRGGRVGRTLAKLREYNTPDVRLIDRWRFVNHKRRYARRYFPPLGLPLQPNHDLDLDVQVIGSDEVFNCVQANTNVGYSRDLFGHGSPAGRLVSYAGSFGNTTWERIAAAGIRDELAEDFARFDVISVRDENSAGIVEALTGTRPAVHVDPALAYDFLGRESRIPAGRLFPGRYLIVYGYSGRLTAAENRELRRHADQLGAAILTFGGVQPCGDRFIDCGPLELLAYFRDAEAVVTDTFHGTIFSLINHVPFASLVRPSVGGGYGNEEKLGFLLDTFGLSGRRLTEPGRLASLLAEPIDFDSVDRILQRERGRTLDYLTSAIGVNPAS